MPNNGTVTESVSMSGLLDRLGERKPDFLDGIQYSIHSYIASQGRRICMSIVEKDGRWDGHPRTHIFNYHSLSQNVTYADVFQCFIRKRPYHGHALDSGLSEPVAGIIASRYGTVLESCTDDLEEYFLGRLVEDEVIRKSLAVHVATRLAEKGVKTARDKLTHLITHAITQHASTHTTIAVQHGVTVATQHTAAVTAGTSAGAVVGSIVGAIMIKAFAAHIAVILPKILASETLRMLVMAATHKVVYVSATAATANLLAAKAGAATASAFLHAIIGPVAILYVVYKLKRLPNELGASIAKGVKRDLDGKFRSITKEVLKEMVKEVFDLEKLVSAVVDDFITVDEWEKTLEGLDVADPAIVSLNLEIARGVSYVNGIQKLNKADEALEIQNESRPASRADFVCFICSLNQGPLEDIDQLTHANGCLDQIRDHENMVVRCWFCNTDLRDMNDVAKNEHLNGCLDRTM
ncbi:hypothetical protein MMC12_005611 [Toensbergia leucococca]|nr:hypothetical protein [Toensbergia leucococca]